MILHLYIYSLPVLIPYRNKVFLLQKTAGRWYFDVFDVYFSVLENVVEKLTASQVAKVCAERLRAMSYSLWLQDHSSTADSVLSEIEWRG